MNKKGSAGKILVTIVIVIVLGFGIYYIWHLIGDSINPQNIKFNYVIPLPIGAVNGEIDFATIQKVVNELTSQIPSNDEIPENRGFAIELTIKFPEKYENVSLRLNHTDKIQIKAMTDEKYNPFTKVDNDIFQFQKDVNAGDISKVIIVGNTVNINEPSFNTNIAFHVISNGVEKFKSDEKTIKICRQSMTGGCSGMLNQVQGLFNLNSSK